MYKNNSVDYVAEHIKELVDSGYQVCIWGTEEKAAKLGVILLDKCEIPIHCYCDGREEKWGKEIVKDKFCITLEELKKNAERYVCIVMINDVDTPDVIQRVESYGVKYCCGFYDLLCSDYALHCFYPFTVKEQGRGIERRVEKVISFDDTDRIEDRIAIYTCIVGKYDEILQPQMIEGNCDYYLVSDNKPQNCLYKWVPLSSLDIPEGLNNSLINRYCKINAHKLFPQYKYSIYLDGNIELKQNISKKYLSKIENKASRIACLKRQTRVSDIYQDSIHVLVSELENEEKVYRQMEKYWREGLPRNHRQLCGRVLVREHNHPNCIKIMKDWWNEVSTQAYRDQLSFMYAVWKNGFAYDDIGWLDVGGWNNEDYVVKKHLDRCGE